MIQPIALNVNQILNYDIIIKKQRWFPTYDMRADATDYSMSRAKHVQCFASSQLEAQRHLQLVNTLLLMYVVPF